MPEHDDMEERHIGDYWRIIKRYKWNILGLAAAVLLVGALSAYSADPVYRADAKLLVEPAQPKFVSLSPLEAGTPIDLFYETQYEVIRSRAIAESAIKKLPLPMQDKLLAASRSGMGGFRNWFTDPLPDDAANLKREALLEQIQDNLSVRGGKRSQLIVVSFEAEDPQLAAVVANMITQAYIEHGMESRLTTVQQATSWLSGRLTELRQQLEKSEAALQAFQTRESLVDTENRKRIISARLANYTAEVIKARASRSEAEIHYQQVKDIQAQGGGYKALVTVLDSPHVQRLLETHDGLERKVSELMERYGEKHPKMIAARADLAEATRRLEVEIGRVVDGIRKTYEAAVTKERELERLIDEQQQNMRSETGSTFQLAKLEREVETNRQLYDTFLARFKEVDVAGEGSLTNVQIVDRAQPPTVPFKPNKKRILIVSLIMGLLFGLGVAFVRERLDNTFRKAEDIEDKLMLPVFTLLPRLAQRQGQQSVPERHMVVEPHSAFAEAINSIRTGVLFSNIDEPARTLLVTSAGPGEGKTTLASNLALSFSQLGRTLLIDADLRHPSLAKISGVPASPGFTEWVSGDKTIQECISQDRQRENLYILPSGAIPPNPLELVSSQRFHGQFETLKAEFDYIVIDTPPVLPASDAVVIGHLVDGVILSIKADETTHEMAQDMLKRLAGANIRPLGAVLSLVDLRKLESHYGGQYYGRYYGAYYGAAAQKPHEDPVKA